MRPNLLRMMSWAVGTQRGFDFSIGKNYKYLDKFLPAADWAAFPKAVAFVAVCQNRAFRLPHGFAMLDRVCHRG